MEPAHYTDPFEEAFSHASQRFAQLASLLGATGQVVWQRRALANARRAASADRRALRVITDQERALHQQTRLAWAPALDPQWLANADLIDVARAWASAVASADADPSADTARRRCEDRLRRLHPHAMAYYDRLRADGADPLDAMQAAAPLFAYAPSARTGDPAPTRLALGPVNGNGTDLMDGPPPAESTPEPAANGVDMADLRGQQIIDRLQTHARASGRPDLGPDELALILAATTNLPESIIDRLTREAVTKAERGTASQTMPPQPSSPALAAEAPAAPTSASHAARARPTVGGTRASASAGRTQPAAAQLAAQCFPHTAAEVISSAAAGSGPQANTRAVRSPAIHKAKRKSRSL